MFNPTNDVNRRHFFFTFRHLTGTVFTWIEGKNLHNKIRQIVENKSISFLEIRDRFFEMRQDACLVSVFFFSTRDNK